MIETRGLRKVYRTKERRQVTMVDAVRGIDLTVAESTRMFARSLR
jgi:ABC-2 type transport system ATP-binding protein